MSKNILRELSYAATSTIVSALNASALQYTTLANNTDLPQRVRDQFSRQASEAINLAADLEGTYLAILQD